MDKKTKILFFTFVVLVILSISATFYKTVILQDFIVYNEIDCDPSIEHCFVWKCDSTISDGDGACTGNPDDDIRYYKIVYKNAQNIPQCNPKDDEGCEPFSCAKGEPDCVQITCSDETLKAYEQKGDCSDISKYNNII